LFIKNINGSLVLISMAEYIIIKRSHHFLPCHRCNESGVIFKTFRKQTWASDCPECGGKGHKQFNVDKDVRLVDALNDINLIKS